MPLMAHLESSRSVLKLAQHISSMFPNSQALRAQCHLFSHVCPPLPSCWVTFSFFAFVYFFCYTNAQDNSVPKGTASARCSNNQTSTCRDFTQSHPHNSLLYLPIWALSPPILGNTILEALSILHCSQVDWEKETDRQLSCNPLDGAVHWLTTQSQGTGYVLEELGSAVSCMSCRWTPTVYHKRPLPPFPYNCTVLGEHLNPGCGFDSLSPRLAFQPFCDLSLVSLAFLLSPPPTILTILVCHCLLTLTTLSWVPCGDQLFLLLCCCDQHHDQQQAEEERFVSSYTLREQSVTEGI